MLSLDKRLSAVFEAIPQGALVADIGTDHAFLAIKLIKCGKAKNVIACDINEKPLQNARKNLERSGCEKIELRLSDGLENVAENETDCIIIAGMGGKVISGIIERCPYLKNNTKTLVLQPMTGADFLRRFLCENGFEIVKEQGVAQGKRLYSVITAQYVGFLPFFDDAFYVHGMLDPKRDEDLLYLKKQQKILLKCVNDLQGVKHKEELLEKNKEILEKITKYILGE